MRNREGLRASPGKLFEARLTNNLYFERRGSEQPNVGDFNDILDPILAALFTTSSYMTRRNLGFRQPVIDKWLVQMSKGKVPNGYETMEEFNYMLLTYLAEHDHDKSPFVLDAKDKLSKINAEKQGKKL